MTIVDIETMRQKHEIPVARLCRAAGITEKTYRRLRAGGEGRPDTVARLTQALAACRRGEKRPVSAAMLFRVVVAQLAMLSDMDVAQVIAHVPQRKATSDPVWRAESQIRAHACYILKSVLGLTNAEVARAAGVTEPAMTLAMQKLEIRRDDAGIDRFYAALEKAVAG